MALIVPTCGVDGTLIAATIGVRSYVNSNKRAEDARKRELDTRQAQMFMNIYERVTSKEFGNAWEKVILTPWKTFDEYSKLWDDPEFNEAAIHVAQTYEGIGVLVREGLLDIRLVALLLCATVRRYGERITPVLEDGRKAMGYRRWLSEVEYLYNELIKYVGEHSELDTQFETSIHSLKK